MSLDLFYGAEDSFLPNFSDRSDFLPIHQEPFLEGSKRSNLGITIDKGSTGIGFKYQGGIILAIDTRSTSGNIITGNNVEKMMEINERILCCYAGNLADCKYYTRVLKRECAVYEQDKNQRINIIEATKIFNNIWMLKREEKLEAELLLAGYDDENVPKLYYMDSNGMRIEEKKFAIGSGAPYALGVFHLLYRYDLTDEEAYDVARRAICQACHDDPSTGGNVVVYHMKLEGWKQISSDDASMLYVKYEMDKSLAAESKVKAIDKMEIEKDAVQAKAAGDLPQTEKNDDLEVEASTSGMCRGQKEELENMRKMECDDKDSD